MSLPTFDGFSLSDSNFIPERIEFKGYASREVVRGKINRREGVKLLGTEFGEKRVTIEGTIIADTASQLQSLLDDMKKALQTEEGDLVIETGRTFKATVDSLAIPDEHYNVTKAPFQITFILSNPYAEGTQLSISQPVTSGLLTFSGSVVISGTMFARPTVVYTPPSNTGQTNIKKLVLSHTPTGQSVTISGFGSGSGLNYNSTVTINFDDLIGQEGTTERDTSGGFARWDPGLNQYTITASGRFVGGTVSLTYTPRYL